MTEYRVEVHQVKPGNKDYSELKHLCFLSKNLYNATLYAVRQYFFDHRKYLNYYDVNRQFTHENQPDYRELPAKVAKQTQILVDQNFKSFFSLLKNKDAKPKIPGYLPKNGYQTVHYNRQALSFKTGKIRLSKTNIYINSKIPKEKVKFVRVVPRGNHIRLEVGYETETVLAREFNGKFASIDPGLNNLFTVVSNVAAPTIYNGRPLKSINQFYNKKKSKLQSVLEVRNKTKHSHKLETLSRVRDNKINDYLHKTTRMLVNYLVSNDITLLVVGRNVGWKQSINIGRRNNQNFVQVPIARAISMLRYKAEAVGIKVVCVEESYTSKCSFSDKETLEHHKSYAGKRKYRGLFIDSRGNLWNADVNGAMNIARKYFEGQEAWNDQYWFDLVEGCSDPCVSVVTPQLSTRS